MAENIDKPTDDLLCDHHIDQELIFFCMTCDSLICIDCITSTHRRHDCVKVKDIINTEKHKLEQLMLDLNESDIPRLEAKVNDIKRKRQENIQHGELVNIDIDCYADKLVNKINDVRDKYKSQNQTLFERNNKILKQMETDLLEDLSVLKKLCEERGQLKQSKGEGHNEYTESVENSKDTNLSNQVEYSEKENEVPGIDKKLQDHGSHYFQGQGQMHIQGTDSHIIKTRIQLCSLLKKIKLSKDDESLNIKMLQFIPGENINEMGEFFGKLEDDQEKSSDYEGTEPCSDTSRRVHEISSFRFGENRILSIRPVDDSMAAWINHYHGNEEVLYLVDNMGSKVKTQNLDFYVNNLFVTSNNEIYISAFTKRTILKIKLDTSKVVPAAVTEPLFPLGIYVTKGKEIFACLVEERTYTIKPSSQRCIKKFSKSGKTIQTIEFDKDNSRLFNQPYRVYENQVTKDLCVVNRSTRTTGELSLFDVKGNFKLTYKGQTGVKFNPMDVICDSQGQIIIADDGDKLHLLDSSGLFICHLLTNNDIKEPHSLGLDGNGNLWIGCWTGKVAIIDYKILST